MLNRIGLISLLLLVAMALPNLMAEEISEEMEEVVVSATRTNLSKKKVTQSIQVVENKEIGEQQVTDIHEILRDVPGASVTQLGSRGSPTSLFVRGGGANHNLILIDGVRINQAGGSFDFAQLPLDNIERIEILKGPQSALYGSDGIGSVIHILTKKGRGTPITELSLAAGNYNTFEERVQTSGGLGNGGFSVGASRIDTDGILNINNRFGETSFSFGMDQKLYDRVDLDVNVRYVDAKFQFPTENGGDRLQISDPEQYNKRRRLILGSSLSSNIASWWKQKLQLGYQNDDRFSKDERNPFVDTAWSQSHSVEIRQSIDYLWNFTLPEVAKLKSQFTAGIAYEKENFEQTSRRVTTSTTSTALDQLRSNYAYYFQNQWDWGGVLFFTPSARVEQNETFSTEASPRFTGGVLIPWTQTKLRSSWGKGITAPSFSQVFGSGGTTIGNPNLKPERVESWEAGVDQYLLDGKIEANVTYFHNIYDNLISFITPTFFNIQSAKSEGVETSVQIKTLWGKEIETRLVLSHTYLETKALVSGGVGGTGFTQGEQLLRRPKHRGAVTINLAHPRFNINLNTTLQGETLDRDFSVTPEVRVSLPAYTKTDLAVSVIALKGIPTFRVFAKIENLFDAKYEEVYGFSTARIKFLSGMGLKF